jgi:AraC family transcriptional regulator, transcriptional activator of pobA
MPASPSPAPSRQYLPQTARMGSAVIGSRMEAAFVRRTWSTASLDRQTRRHAFFVTHGRAAFLGHDGADIELNAPALLWLPRSSLGEFHLEAGGEGIALSILEDFVWRTVGDSGAAIRLRPLLDRIAIATSERILSHLDELETSFSALVRESHDPQPGGSMMMGLHLGVVLLHLWRASGLETSRHLRGTGANTVQRFRQLIELHYREGLGVDEFARLLGVTRAHLHDACLRGVGTTPLGLIHARLMEEACQRLEQTELSIEQIGYSLGFRDPGYFNRFFKRLAGLSPGAYRKAAARPCPAHDPSSFAAWP